MSIIETRINLPWQEYLDHLSDSEYVIGQVSKNMRSLRMVAGLSRKELSDRTVKEGGPSESKIATVETKGHQLTTTEARLILEVLRTILDETTECPDPTPVVDPDAMPQADLDANKGLDFFPENEEAE